MSAPTPSPRPDNTISRDFDNAACGYLESLLRNVVPKTDAEETVIQSVRESLTSLNDAKTATFVAGHGWPDR